MLTRVEFTNYRGFKTYRMEGLARVNLLVGKNNSGKTAILEGVQFLTSGGDPAVLLEVAKRRGEMFVSRSDSKRAESSSVDIAHLFHGHTLTNTNQVALAGDNCYKSVLVSTYIAKNGRPDGAEPSPPRSHTPGFFLKILIGTGNNREDSNFRISSEGGIDFETHLRYGRTGPLPRLREARERFVGPDSLSSGDLAEMWDELTLTGHEADVAEAMRILETNMESLHFLSGIFASGRVPSRGGIVVGIKGQDARVPLGSMGDGMRRLLALAASLAFTKGGCLFVDEIDTGLHYSVMADLWKLVITKAVASNTQVFATTHSWDCIEGLTTLCQDRPDLMREVAVHKIDRAIPHSVEFSGESIVRMVKSDIDPR